MHVLNLTILTLLGNIFTYRLEQFNDVLFQENRTSEHMESPLLDESQLELLAKKKMMLLEILKVLFTLLLIDAALHNSLLIISLIECLY